MTMILCVSNERERARARESEKEREREMGAFKPLRAWGEVAAENFSFFQLFIYSERDKGLKQRRGNAITAMSTAHISLKKIK